ncbi:MAG: DUF1963 domain-containing protein [Thermoleophilia bacterium]|nr:DUF1963 domain-containing protein [Thermoleophilia bacterium]
MQHAPRPSAPFAAALAALAMAFAGCAAPDTGSEPPVRPETASYDAHRAERPASPAVLRAMLRGSGLSDARVEDAVRASRPGVLLVREGERAAALAGGESRVGGAPLMPPDAPWPTRGGFRLVHVAQLDLDAIGGRVPGLPRSGLMQFFMDIGDLDLSRALSSPTGLDPVVIWQRRRDGLVLRRDGPADWGPDPIPMGLTPVFSTPLPGDTAFAEWSPADRLRYERVMMEPRVIDQVGGRPFELQEDPVLGAALRGAGVDPQRLLPGPLPAFGDRRAVREYNRRWTRRAVALARPGDWTMLLQLETAPGDGMWGDAGTMTFAVRTADLRERRFDRVLGEMASH